MATLGEMLVSARENAGHSAVEIAQTTRIMLSAVQALEEDHFKALPAPGYVRGYILSYCRYIGVDPQAYLDQYEIQTGNMRHDSLGQFPIDRTADRARGVEHEMNWRIIIPVALIVMALASLVYIGNGLGKKHTNTIPPVPSETSATAEMLAANQETLVPFAFTVKAKEGRASKVTINIEGIGEAYNGELVNGQKKSYTDALRAKLTIKKPKNVVVTQNDTDIPIPENGKLTLTAHE